MRFAPLVLSSTFALAACSSSDPVAPDAGAATPPTSQCVAPTGAGTRHDGESITADTTWTAADSPHRITYSPTVRAGATLRIEPCAEVRIAGGYGLLVEGRLEALGTAETPIAITADDPAAPFGYLEVRGGFADLAYVSISGGGAEEPNGNAMLEVWGASTDQRTDNARLRHVALTGSEQHGLTLERSGALTADSTDVVIHGAKLAPVAVYGSALVGSVPAGDYTGNGADEIVVVARDPMIEDTTWHARGVPYHLGDANQNGADFRVGASTGAALATWTIEPGVTIRAADAARILVQKSGDAITGSIVARGTAAAPVVFTSASASPAPGLWRGLVFEAAPAATTALDHVEIRYAGGPSQANSFHCEPGSDGSYSRDEDAALAVFGEPASAFLTHSLLADSAADGVDLAYHGAALDFAAGNTFTGIARCRVTLPRSTDGSCPTPVPACQ